MNSLKKWLKDKKAKSEEPLVDCGDFVEEFPNTSISFSGHIKAPTPSEFVNKLWFENPDFPPVIDYQEKFLKHTYDHNAYKLLIEEKEAALLKPPTSWSSASSESILADIIAAQKAIMSGSKYSNMGETSGKSKPKNIDSRPDTESEVWDE